MANTGYQPRIFAETFDVVCFSPERWRDAASGVRGLLEVFAQSRRVFFIEPARREGGPAFLECVERGKVILCTPHLLETVSDEDAAAIVRTQLRQVLSGFGITRYAGWYADPAMLDWTPLPAPIVCIYDALDDISACEARSNSEDVNRRLLKENADIIFASSTRVLDDVPSSKPKLYLFDGWGTPLSVGERERQRSFERAARRVTTLIERAIRRKKDLKVTSGGQHSLRIWQ